MTRCRANIITRPLVTQSPCTCSDEVYFTASMAYLALRPGARFRIAVPDAYNPDPNYIHYIRIGGVPGGLGASHQVPYTHQYTDYTP